MLPGLLLHKNFRYDSNNNCVQLINQADFCYQYFCWQNLVFVIAGALENIDLDVFLLLYKNITLNSDVKSNYA